MSFQTLEETLVHFRRGLITEGTSTHRFANSRLFDPHVLGIVREFMMNAKVYGQVAASKLPFFQEKQIFTNFVILRGIVPEITDDKVIGNCAMHKRNCYSSTALLKDGRVFELAMRCIYVREHSSCVYSKLFYTHNRCINAICYGEKSKCFLIIDDGGSTYKITLDGEKRRYHNYDIPGDIIRIHFAPDESYAYMCSQDSVFVVDEKCVTQHIIGNFEYPIDDFCVRENKDGHIELIIATKKHVFLYRYGRIVSTAAHSEYPHHDYCRIFYDEQRRRIYLYLPSRRHVYQILLSHV